jgi:hypothetical protein
MPSRRRACSPAWVTAITPGPCSASACTRASAWAAEVGSRAEVGSSRAGARARWRARAGHAPVLANGEIAGRRARMLTGRPTRRTSASRASAGDRRAGELRPRRHGAEQRGLTAARGALDDGDFPGVDAEIGAGDDRPPFTKHDHACGCEALRHCARAMLRSIIARSPPRHLRMARSDAMVVAARRQPLVCSRSVIAAFTPARGPTYSRSLTLHSFSSAARGERPNRGSHVTT